MIGARRGKNERSEQDSDRQAERGARRSSRSTSSGAASPSGARTDAFSIRGLFDRDPEPGLYLVQFFDWIIGEPSTMTIMPVETMRWRPFKDPGSVILFKDDICVSGWSTATGSRPTRSSPKSMIVKPMARKSVSESPPLSVSPPLRPPPRPRSPDR